MSDADLTRVLSSQYPSAHLGHLSASQQESLDAFKALCQSEGYYTPAGTGEKTRPSHDDETLLRYLRARKFVPKDAFTQFKDTEDWRKENNLGELYETIDVTEYEETRRLYPQWTGRRDRRGIPVYLFEVAHLNSKAVSAYTNSTSKSTPASSKVPVKMLRLFALYENLTRFVMPLCSAITDRPHPETPISQSNNIVDISGVGLKMFWNLKNHMQDASQLATAHYPETLDRIFIIGAPSFFPTVWGWVKRWFDPITVSKIFILSSTDMKKVLEEFIEPANIPKKYGGELDFEFGMMPVLEPAIESALKWENPAQQNGLSTFPSGPIRWEETPDGAFQALAVGSEDGNQRKSVIAQLPGGRHVIRTAYGQAINTPLEESELHFTTAASTHPASTGADEPEEGPPDSGTSTPGGVPVIGAAPSTGGEIPALTAQTQAMNLESTPVNPPPSRPVQTTEGKI